MLREDLELLTDLKRACNQAGQFALEYLAGDLSIEMEEAYALRLIHVGERLLAHVKRRKGLVLDSEPAPLAIDVEFVRVDDDVRALPPGSQPNGAGL
jgi:hypothetical protein